MDPLEDFLIGFNILIMNEINENLLPLAVIRDLFVEDNGNDDEIENIAINAVIEIAEGIIPRRRRTCITNYIEQIVPMYTDEEFIMHYRLKRMLFRSMVDRFSYCAHFRNLGGHGGFEVVSAEKHILFYGLLGIKVQVSGMLLIDLIYLLVPLNQCYKESHSFYMI
ncbi:uncharacterized protein LOC112589745 isoform X1 [Harpegnathos saltator]|uniref:uncharacterized protein LOC112589745 isoform X1 n=1 Tax=Harpegnathos saltator TaxID=610380 RepID=UPI000DBEE527|nr:uncharacterized protein LOC112589745 isoform X1 [Harpegnathos saltator]